MTSWEFPGSEPIDILIDIAAGSIAVAAEPADVTTVLLEASGRSGERLLSEVSVTFSQGRLEIIEPKDKRNLLRGHAGLDVTVMAPADSSCVVRTASADVSCMGRLAELEARTASGDVTAGSVTRPAGGPDGLRRRLAGAGRRDRRGQHGLRRHPAAPGGR